MSYSLYFFTLCVLLYFLRIISRGLFSGKIPIIKYLKPFQTVFKFGTSPIQSGRFGPAIVSKLNEELLSLFFSLSAAADTESYLDVILGGFEFKDLGTILSHAR